MSEQATYTEHVYQEYCCGSFVDPLHQREEIVRCRDCKHYQVVDEIFDGEDDTAVYGCGILGWKVASYGCEEPTDPDGFCAWGERKGDTE